MANPRLGVCARRWKRPSEHLGATFRTHMSKCLKGRKIVKRRKAKGRAASRGGTCARACNEKVARRIAHGDKTPKATMKAVCMRKCAERPAAVSVAASPAPVKRDVNALCARYSSDASVRARCVAGEVGPGLLLRKLTGRAPIARTAEYRLAKRLKKLSRKRRGMIRRAALKMKQGAGMKFVLRSPFGPGRKTIGRKRR